MQVLGLDEAELVGIFHVSPAALTEWRRGGVPAEHAAALSALEDVAKRLAVWLDPGRVAAFVHQPRSEFEGRSLLQCLAEEGSEAVHRRIDGLLASGLIP